MSWQRFGGYALYLLGSCIVVQTFFPEGWQWLGGFWTGVGAYELRLLRSGDRTAKNQDYCEEKHL